MDYIQFKENEKVTITDSILQLTAEEFCMEQNEYEVMVNHIGKPARIICENEETFNYVTIEFEDGYTIEAIAVESFYCDTQVIKIK